MVNALDLLSIKREHKDTKLFVYNFSRCLSYPLFCRKYNIRLKNKIFILFTPKSCRYSGFLEEMKEKVNFFDNKIKRKILIDSIVSFLNLEAVTKFLSKSDLDPFLKYSIFFCYYLGTHIGLNSLSIKVEKDKRELPDYSVIEIGRIVDFIRRGASYEYIGRRFGYFFGLESFEEGYEKIGKIIYDMYSRYEQPPVRINIEKEMLDKNLYSLRVFFENMFVISWGKSLWNMIGVFEEIKENLGLERAIDVLYLLPHELFRKDAKEIVKKRKKSWYVLVRGSLSKLKVSWR